MKPNHNPRARKDSAVTIEDTSSSIAVLSNDRDSDGDPLTVTGFTDGANGTVIDNGDGTLTYTPDLNFNGSDSFSYTVGDGNGGFDTATVTVDVTAVNDAPTANDDTAATPSGTATTIDVLSNDSDPEDDTLSIAAVSDPANGTAAITYQAATWSKPAVL